MCGRFALGIARGRIVQNVARAHPNLQLGGWVNEDNFHPRYNVAPRSQAPVIRRRYANAAPRGEQRAPGDAGPSGSENAQEPRRNEDGVKEEDSKPTNVLHTMKWGLIPSWNKHEDTNLNTINAKSENLLEGTGMYTSIRGKKRCIVVCEGYYEWVKKGKDRIPHFTKHKNGDLMLLAGLYDCVLLEGQSEPLWTFTIVTTDANKEFSWLHDRQPIILTTDEAIDTWLDTSSQKWTKEVAAILHPYTDTSTPLECYQVPKEVGKVGAESSTFTQPVAKRKDGIQAMFAKAKAKSQAKSETPPRLQLSTSKRKRSSSPDHTLGRLTRSPERKVKAKLEDSGSQGVKSESSEVVESQTTIRDGFNGSNSGQAIIIDDSDEDNARPKLKAMSRSPRKQKPKILGKPNDAKITKFFT